MPGAPRCRRLATGLRRTWHMHVSYIRDVSYMAHARGVEEPLVFSPAVLVQHGR
jgi:hypothetical protein